MHVYALVVERPSLTGTGLEGRPLQLVEGSALTAVVSSHTAVPAPSEATAVVHAQVAERLAEDVAVLPVRYGADHPDVAAVRRAIDARAEPLRCALAEVAGRVEIAVRAEPAATIVAPVPTATPPADDDRGRAYLATRLARERQEEAAWHEARRRLDAATEDLAGTAVRSLAVETARGPERAYLVDRAVADDFADRAAAGAAGHEGVVVVGPWLPYTFAAGGAL